MLEFYNYLSYQTDLFRRALGGFEILKMYIPKIFSFGLSLEARYVGRFLVKQVDPKSDRACESKNGQKHHRSCKMSKLIERNQF